MTVHSAPYGAEVFVDGEPVGRTPCKFKASTVIGCEYVVEVKLPGYRPYVETVETEWGPGTTWNLLSSLIFLSPLIILTPFFGDVVPGAIFAPLEPEPAPTAAGPAPPTALADEEVR
ncbi:MAG: PEGA domain-containing protein [Planctomycetota bacterium]|nr:PEGA domain-containing protein [Planctomycetota bacterium]